MQTWKITLDSPTDLDREKDIQTLHIMCANRTVHWDFDITNDGIVSGFTSKGAAIQSLFTKDKKDSMLCGVLFRVCVGW